MAKKSLQSELYSVRVKLRMDHVELVVIRDSDNAIMFKQIKLDFGDEQKFNPDSSVEVNTSEEIQEPASDKAEVVKDESEGR